MLSVRVHTSLCAAPPGPDPIAQTRSLPVTSPTAEDAVAAPLRLRGTLIFIEFGDTVRMIYSSLRAPADYVWGGVGGMGVKGRGWTELLFEVPCSCELFSL